MLSRIVVCFVSFKCCLILFYRVKQLFELYGQATKCTRWMPWQLEAMKDVGACDKARGAGKHALILAFLNGETHPIYWVSYTEYIGIRGEPGELKHLSTRRKRNQPRFPQQRRAKGDQPSDRRQWKLLESCAIEGDSPVHESKDRRIKQDGTRVILSEDGGTILQG